VHRRKNLGNIHPGDGWAYIGRGPIQITGRYNYTEFQKFYNKVYPASNLDFIKHPNLINSTDEIAMIASMFWCKQFLWNKFVWNEFTDPKEVSSFVNTGKIGKVANGMKARLKYFENINKFIDCD
jgi:putative chitinase